MTPTLSKSSRWTWPDDLKANIAPAAVHITSFSIENQSPSNKRFARADIQKAVVDANRPLLGKSARSSSIEAKFRLYADKWYAETRRDSSVTRILSNENYLKVIELGPGVVPFILKELESVPAPWFLVLRILTGEKDIDKGCPGNFQKMAEAWIKWGKERAHTEQVASTV